MKIFVGVEYECPCGHRFMCSSPEKVLKATGSGLVRDNGSKVTNCDMPLYFPCPCRLAISKMRGLLFVTVNSQVYELSFERTISFLMETNVDYPTSPRFEDPNM